LYVVRNDQENASQRIGLFIAGKAISGFQVYKMPFLLFVCGRFENESVAGSVTMKKLIKFDHGSKLHYPDRLSWGRRLRWKDDLSGLSKPVWLFTGVREVFHRF
jgi:hypothetical protein